MKKINPVNVWINGEQKEAKYLVAISIQDTLNDENGSANFSYSLNESSVDDEGNEIVGAILINGNVIMDPDEYAAWDNSNDGAYQFIAAKLNLSIIN